MISYLLNAGIKAIVDLIGVEQVKNLLTRLDSVKDVTPMLKKK